VSTVTNRPTFIVLELSDSFQSVWSDLAEELDVQCTLQPPEAEVADRAFAVVLAAGGEEDRALDVLPSISKPRGTPLMLVGAQASHRFAVEALRRGADDFFAFPSDLDLVRRTLGARAEAARERSGSAPATRPATDSFAALIGKSDAITETIEQARRVAQHGDVTVLVQGETGTGKEVLARALHDDGPRAQGPFVTLNCAAIPSQLMESELFGHERGAFTDAHAAKPGLFEEADDGTLFLDEIGHLALPLQGKLLRVLEEHRIRRVGATRGRDVNVRIVAATHVDLRRAVERGEFREDLYYRLNIVALTLPPLRERGADVELLAEAFAASLAERYQLPAPRLTTEVHERLQSHAWPGNVRELRHAIERALLLSPAGALDPRHLIPQPRGAEAKATVTLPFPATLDRIEVAAARAALEQHEGNKSAAARALGISRARLQRLLDSEEVSE
jgi:two-component system response regulator HydG